MLPGVSCNPDSSHLAIAGKGRYRCCASLGCVSASSLLLVSMQLEPGRAWLPNYSCLMALPAKGYMISPHKDLRSGNPVWCAYPIPSVPHAALNRDIRADVVIVGAGISGALMAEELTDAGFAVVIVDRRAPGRGSTMATTALLQYEIDQPLTILAGKIGWDRAAAAWRRSKLSVDSLAARTQSLNIRCDLQRRTSLYLNGDVLNAEQLQREQALRRQIGIHSDYLTRSMLRDAYQLSAQAALLSFDTYSANPASLCARYLLHAIQGGAQVYSPVEIAHVESSARRVHLHASDGPGITTRYAVFTTGYELVKPLQNQNYKIASTWVFATSKQKTAVYRNFPMIWQASDPYVYLRSTRDGRVICGGADEQFSSEEERNALLSGKVKLLQSKLRRLLPHLHVDAEFAWTGSFGETPNGLPLIGAIPGMPNCFAVMAFGGNGITFSRLGAELIRGVLTGKPDPDEKLFGFRK